MVFHLRCSVKTETYSKRNSRTTLREFPRGTVSGGRNGRPTLFYFTAGPGSSSGWMKKLQKRRMRGFDQPWQPKGSSPPLRR